MLVKKMSSKKLFKLDDILIWIETDAQTIYTIRCNFDINYLNLVEKINRYKKHIILIAISD